MIESFITGLDQAENRQEFGPAEMWLRRILNAKMEPHLIPHNNSRRRIYKSVTSLSAISIKNLNLKLADFLNMGHCLVFWDGQARYLILDPQKQMLVDFAKDDLHKQDGLPKSLPAVYGELSAQITTVKQSNEARFSATCGPITLARPFDRTDSANIPTLNAINLDTDKATLLFGYLKRDRLVRIKQAA